MTEKPHVKKEKKQREPKETKKAEAPAEKVEVP
jgi:hypothetical protein